MQVLSTLSVLALAGSVLAAPSVATPERDVLAPRQALTIEQVKNTKFVKNGKKALLKAYAKYGIAPKKNTLGLHEDANGSVVATPEDYDSEYLCPVSIDGQTLNLDFDSGSSDL
jgi:hypothetical protein